METARRNNWEDELWDFINNGDGVHCPFRDCCRYRLKNHICISENEEHVKIIHQFIDEDDNPDPARLKVGNHYLYSCIRRERIFELVRKAARKYRKLSFVVYPAVRSNTVAVQISGQLRAEVRPVPLKSIGGAVWKLGDEWVIQLNSNDTHARQRFTLYHELFHVLARCHTKHPLPRNMLFQNQSHFNELLADHFAGVLMTPIEMLGHWREVRDLNRMAVIFDVPKPVLYMGLRFNRLL
jgi:Zn-dependent peptidase ImmA (M78 family)